MLLLVLLSTVSGMAGPLTLGLAAQPCSRSQPIPIPSAVKLKQEPHLLQTHNQHLSSQSCFEGPKLEATEMSPCRHHTSGCHVTKSSP